MKDVPYLTHEGDMARMDRVNKRLWTVIILLIVLLVGSNLAWVYYDSQFEDKVVTTQKVQQEADGGDNTFVGGDVNGEN